MAIMSKSCPSCTAGRTPIWGVSEVIGSEPCTRCGGSGRITLEVDASVAVALYNRNLNAFPAYADAGLARVGIVADLLREAAPHAEILISAMENAALAAMSDAFNDGITWAVAELPAVVDAFVADGGEFAYMPELQTA